MEQDRILNNFGCSPVSRVELKNIGPVESGQLFDISNSSSYWLNTREAANYLRTSPNQIRNWVYQGKIKAYKLLGKSLRFKISDLDFLHKGDQVWR
jgi:excisionase family DNA binding protein